MGTRRQRDADATDSSDDDDGYSSSVKRRLRQTIPSKYSVLSINELGIFLIRMQARESESPLIIRVSANAMTLNREGSVVDANKLVPGDQVFVDDYQPNYFVPHESEAVKILERGNLENVQVRAMRLHIVNAAVCTEQFTIIVKSEPGQRGFKEYELLDPLNLDTTLRVELPATAFFRKFDFVTGQLVDIENGWHIAPDQKMLLPPEYSRFFNKLRDFSTCASNSHMFVDSSLKFDDKINQLAGDFYQNVNFNRVRHAKVLEKLMVLAAAVYQYDQNEISRLSRREAKTEIDKVVDSKTVDLKAEIKVSTGDRYKDDKARIKARYRANTRVLFTSGSLSTRAVLRFVDEDKRGERLALYFAVDRKQLEKGHHRLEDIIEEKHWQIEVQPKRVMFNNFSHILQRGLLSSIAKTNDPSPAEMMIAQLTGIDYGTSKKLHELPQPDEDTLICLREQMHDCQNRVITSVLSQKDPMIGVISPPASGRTVTLRAAIKVCSLTYDYIFVTSANMASVEKIAHTMAEDTHKPLLLHSYRRNVHDATLQLLCLDQTLDEIHYDEQFPYKHGLNVAETIQEARRVIKQKNDMFLRQDDRTRKNRNVKLEQMEDEGEQSDDDEAQEQSLYDAIKIAMSYRGTKVIMGSIATIMSYCKEMRDSKIAIMLVDAERVPLIETMSLLNFFRNTRKMVVFGDTAQYQREEYSFNLHFKQLIFTSTMDGLLKTKEAPCEDLSFIYNYHPLLFNSFNKFAYQHMRLNCNPDAERQTKFTHFKLPFVNEKSPVVLIDVNSEEKMMMNKSLSNLEQERIAFMLYELITHRRKKPPSVAILASFKSVIAHIVERGVPENLCRIAENSHSVTADVAIYVSTRTDISEKKYSIDSKTRITSILTRGKHGLIIVGKLRYLETLDNWSEALKILKKEGRAHIVSGNQIKEFHQRMPPKLIKRIKLETNDSNAQQSSTSTNNHQPSTSTSDQPSTAASSNPQPSTSSVPTNLQRRVKNEPIRN